MSNMPRRAFVKMMSLAGAVLGELTSVRESFAQVGKASPLTEERTAVVCLRILNTLQSKHYRENGVFGTIADLMASDLMSRVDESSVKRLGLKILDREAWHLGGNLIANHTLSVNVSEQADSYQVVLASNTSGPLLSGHKSNRGNWLASSMVSNWEATSKTAVEMGIFSNRVMLRICSSL